MTNSLPSDKTCRDCGQARPLADFPPAMEHRDGRGSYCRPTAADVAAMVEAQGGLCLLCRERPAQHVDHDHLTGRVRGVLCSCCNQGLGNFRDRADVLRLAIDYLERTTCQKERVCTGVYRLTTPRPAAAASRSSSELQHLISSRRG